MSGRVIEDRPGFPEALRASAGGVAGGRSALLSKSVGGHTGAPDLKRVIEERHGFPGALRASGSVGGHIGAPHVNR